MTYILIAVLLGGQPDYSADALFLGQYADKEACERAKARNITLTKAVKVDRGPRRFACLEVPDKPVRTQ